MILDYLRKSANGEIIIPNFHTGHLGFVPGTEVSVSLHELFIESTNKRHCELLVTPFDPNFSSLCYLTCTMKDQPGVVNKLIEAISSLRINIVKQESSSINSLNHHVVELVLDWKTSQYRSMDERTPSELVGKFKNLTHLMPIKLYKYFVLYKAIMSRCGDVINFDNVYGESLPSLKIIPFSESTHTYDVRRVQIKRKDDSSKTKTLIELDPKHIGRIRLMCDYKNGDPLHYIISSEANTRSLRIFFLNSNSIDKTFHVSFTHNDIPGALSAITAALVEANFNILTGLLRKKDNVQSGYETLLEYEGEKGLPEPHSSKHLKLDWIHKRISEISEKNLALLTEFNIEIGTPLYPKNEVSDPIIINYKNHAKHSSNKLKESDILLETLNSIKNSQEDNILFKKERISILELIQRTIAKKPVIFLSYPSYATSHALMLRLAIDEAFSKKYEIKDYQEPDFENILNKVMQEINNCDYFIGIWHHEYLKGREEYGISPWMPFEYGIAKSSNKGIIIIHSDKLPEPIWKRIDPSISRPNYNDLNFKEILIPKVLAHLKREWQGVY